MSKTKNVLSKKKDNSYNKNILIAFVAILILTTGLFLVFNIINQEQDTADASENNAESSSMISDPVKEDTSSSISNTPSQEEPEVIDNTKEDSEESPILEYRRREIERLKEPKNINPEGSLDSSSISDDSSIDTADGGSYAGDRIVQTVRGSDNGIYTRFSNNGSSWSKWSASGKKTIGKPSQTVLPGDFGSSDTLIETILGEGGFIYTRTTTDGINWTNWTGPNGRAISTPSHVVVFDSQVNDDVIIQTVRGSDNGIYTRRSYDGINWEPWSGRNGSTIDAPSQVIVWDDDEIRYAIVQTVRGSDNGIYTRRSTNAGRNWSTWSSRSGSTIDTPTQLRFTTFPNFDEFVIETIRANGNGIYTRRSDDAGKTWSAWTGPIGSTIDVPSQVMIYDPSIGNYHIVQVVRGSDNGIYTRVSPNGINWEPWSGRNGSTIDTPTLIKLWDSVSYNEYVIQTVRGSNDSIYTRRSSDSGRSWSEWNGPNGKTVDTPQQSVIYIP
jgi:hypothetical protein